MKPTFAFCLRPFARDAKSNAGAPISPIRSARFHFRRASDAASDISANVDLRNPRKRSHQGGGGGGGGWGGGRRAPWPRRPRSPFRNPPFRCLAALPSAIYLPIWFTVRGRHTTYNNCKLQALFETFLSGPGIRALDITRIQRTPTLCAS